MLSGMSASTFAMAKRTSIGSQPAEGSSFLQQNPKVAVRFTFLERSRVYGVGTNKPFDEGMAQAGSWADSQASQRCRWAGMAVDALAAWLLDVAFAPVPATGVDVEPAPGSLECAKVGPFQARRDELIGGIGAGFEQLRAMGVDDGAVAVLVEPDVLGVPDALRVFGGVDEPEARHRAAAHFQLADGSAFGLLGTLGRSGLPQCQ